MAPSEAVAVADANRDVIVGIKVRVGQRRDGGFRNVDQSHPAVIIGDGQSGPAILGVGLEKQRQLLESRRGLPESGAHQAPVEDVVEGQLGEPGQCQEFSVELGAAELVTRI